jgi:tRNA-dihydrouridine synthase A
MPPQQQDVDRDNTNTSTLRLREDEAYPKELHIAPMLHVSTREFRALLRILSKRAVLWTEMIVDETLAYAENREEHLASPSVPPKDAVCQIGGNSPELCGQAAALVAAYGYKEVNLNIDCPSERVSGQREFGACLMKKAQLSKQILQAMATSSPLPVSVKCRVGVDQWDDLEFAAAFIQALQPVCRRFYLHARKCVLGGVCNARANRSVPPLNYPRVYQLCRRFPDCQFWINGGIRSIQEAKRILQGREGPCCSLVKDGHAVPCDLCNLPYGSCCEPPARAPSNLRGCMMGRAAFDHPCLFWDVDRSFYGEPTNPCWNRRQVLEKYCQFLEKTYPRRCCDADDRVTFQYPAPEAAVEKEFCTVCQDIYGPNQPSGTSTVPPQCNNYKAKIASRIIGRSLKPIQGIFHGVPKSRAFKRACDDLGQDPTVRNCGPGYILRKAMRTIPDHILDRPFDAE